MPVDLERSNVLINLLEASTSLAVVSAFLKRRGLHYSAGSWEAMRNLRLLKHLENEAISNFDLESLVQEVEEYGRQHVFLYSCDSLAARAMLDRVTVGRELEARGLERLIDSSTLVETPQGAEIVDVRWESDNGRDFALVIKEVELRTYVKYLRAEQRGTQLLKVYDRINERAVNIARLHITGALELRIASRRNTTRYEQDIYDFFSRIDGLIDSSAFTELSITAGKDYIWKNRKLLSEQIRSVDATMRNAEGNVLRGATGRMDSDLSDDDAVADSLDVLLDGDANAYCDAANIYFKPTEKMSAETHVILSGEPNEFALPAKCTKGDYEHVLEQIRFFNR